MPNPNYATGIVISYNTTQRTGILLVISGQCVGKYLVFSDEDCGDVTAIAPQAGLLLELELTNNGRKIVMISDFRYQAQGLLLTARRGQNFFFRDPHGVEYCLFGVDAPEEGVQEDTVYNGLVLGHPGNRHGRQRLLFVERQRVV